MKKVRFLFILFCALIMVISMATHASKTDNAPAKEAVACKAEVDLLSFKLSTTADICKVSWVSFRETGLKTYVLERSLDYNEFVEVAKVNGAVNSENIVRYTIQDVPGKAEAIVYRLKIADCNGNKKAVYAAQLTQEEVQAMAYNK